MYQISIKIKFLSFIVSTIFLVSGCSPNGGGGNSNTSGNGNNSNTGFSILQNLSIIGSHNSIYGTSLEIGTVFTKPSTGGGLYPDQVILYDKAVSIINSEGQTTTTDPDNGIAIVINSFKANPQFISSISMGIKVNKVNYMYACENPFRNNFNFCGNGISIDLVARTLTLTDVDVQSTPTKGVIMRLNGTLNW